MAEIDQDKPRRRGPIRALWDINTYFLRRSFGDMRSSARGVGQQWQAVHELRVQREERAREAAGAYEREMEGKSPRERFELRAQELNWTPQELRTQEASARVTRRACLVFIALGFTGWLALLFVASWLWIAIYGLLGVALLACCMALAVKNAWWEFMLQGRVLIPMRDFLARPDFFRRLFL